MCVDLPIAQFVGGDTEDSATGAGRNPDSRRADIGREFSETWCSVRTRDHQLTIGKPGQIQAAVRHNTLSVGLGR
ncbi:hypothetical protein JGU71_20935 [Antrihabitans sp. YC3-6]|uniref:Uncharacterized protein n=1 Tax=Antrihabitans stalagmiti TaxID=2799499 RepID=A0A934U5B1_9NOCA|nr:hypothetical protein [Antrihabitans stalagmiti]MBJ8341355.1 hypothetical protein [Antrihabitans stalagmiti]